MSDLIPGFDDSLQTGFVDKSIVSNPDYQPELLINQRQPPRKVLSSILYEFENCNEFFISVAFVTTSGVAVIINTLKNLEVRGVRGKMLVSQYLNFTQPEALRRLLQFKNIELKISTTGNTHTKGYIFKNKNYFNLIVGSSNLTDQALATNKEWNIKVSALDNSAIVDKVLGEFHSDFKKAIPVTPKFIFDYEGIHRKQSLFRSNNDLNEIVELQTVITPNSMQIEALENLRKLRLDGKGKALIISATGTGKTYLSAFDAKEFNPDKMLFVVHRLSIAKKSLETFRAVFGNKKTMGLYSGDDQDLDSEFVFSTVQTISKYNHLKKFNRNQFDYIIIDETHRSAAESYLQLLEYFKPKFLLGMTATPDRSDNNDIFKNFDYNIAYEIRLSKAMEEDLLSPFHYYGVADLSINNVQIKKKSDFRFLVANERVERIIEKAKFYGSDNGITRGLIFCSGISEAKELSDAFNLRGFNTIALTGNNSEQERSNSFDLLESDNLSEKLDYIFAVDILNEGIDIPKINQIILLRPTKSAIIFIQQLGRGLRKADGKSYLTVIDFIGNYANNYLIPIALYGDTSYNKDSLRKLITEGSRMIPGSSTINFDEITKERIFASIDSANMQLFSELKKDYSLLQFKLGKQPMMMDFIEHGSRDPFLYVEYSKSYYNFVLKVEKTKQFKLSSEQSILLELFSIEINNAKRVEESLVLQMLIEKGKFTVEQLKEKVFAEYRYSISDETIDSCLNNLNFKFVRKEKKIIYMKKNAFHFYPEFLYNLTNPTFKSYLLDSINYSIYTFNKNYNFENYKNGLVLYNKYSRKDVCRLLNWEKDISSTVYGYRTNNETTPCFVTYHKSDTIESSINYNDHFVNQSTFAWESRSNRKLVSKEIKAVIKSKRILLFVKKEDAEGSDFYYMGDVSIIPDSIKQEIMPGSKKPVVHFKFQLRQPVLSSLYEYITKEKTKQIDNTSKLKKVSKNTPIQKIINFEEKLKNPIPLYNFYAAAGTFSEMQSEKEYTLIEGPVKSSGKGYFACKIIGESMNRVIPNGSICLFKQYEGGSRNGKIVLLEYRDIQDPDFNSAFAIKTYTSEKSVLDESWGHEAIVLKPNSYDSSYPDIVITEENSEGLRVIGIFIGILNDNKN